MVLATYSKFYYGFKIDEYSELFSLKDSAEAKAAKLSHGTYTFSELVLELQRALNAVGSQVYTVTADRATRRVTISAAEPFELLGLTGPGEFASAYPIFGFRTDIDLVGSNSYTGDFGAGKEYIPQCYLQSYVSPENNKRPIDAVKKKTATGVVESVRFGEERLMECEMLFITNIPQPSGSIIRSNLEAVEQANDFLSYATTLAEVEFMPDENDPENFQVLVLESTEYDSNGMGYKLREEYEDGLPGYFRSGILVWQQRGAA